MPKKSKHLHIRRVKMKVLKHMATFKQTSSQMEFPLYQH